MAQLINDFKKNIYRIVESSYCSTDHTVNE
jgi:hypothetical protein